MRNVHWNFLKYLWHVTIIHMHLPMKQLLKWMHKYRENEKMVVGDGGQFLEMCAPEFAEIAWACYHHHMHLSMKHIIKQMHSFQDMIKTIFCSMYFDFL